MNVFLLMLPLLLIVFTGYCSARFYLFSNESNEYFTKFAFFIAMPCQLFFDFSKTPVSQSIYLPYILAFVSCMLVTGLFMFLFSRYFLKKSLAESALNIMGSSQVNAAYFAIPLFILIFNNPAPVLPILIFQAVVLTTIALLIIEHDLKEKSIEIGGYYTKKIKNIFSIMIKNPIILSCLFGVIFSFFNIALPQVLNTYLKLVGETAAPLVLFSLGQSIFFDFKKLPEKN